MSEISYDIVFCIDKKFNKQAFLSIASFYKTNINFKNKIYIIHKSPRSFKKYSRKIKHLFPKSNMELVKFKFNIKQYPNLKNSHVSEATYYRMFIADHVESLSSNLIYIDADAFFIKDVNDEILKIAKIVNSQNLLLSAKTEHIYSEAIELFKRLGINDRYFNAGIMIINFQKWKEENVSEKLRTKVNQIRNNINYWDQDVLNSFVNGKFEELPLELNYTVDVSNAETNIPNEIKIIHYSGKSKPWDKKEKSSNFVSYYQELEQYFKI
tara:strand:+ start:1181 stop:1984 length:804 start_codon:yes stop_codon:yes gene_type:complete